MPLFSFYVLHILYIYNSHQLTTSPTSRFRDPRGSKQEPHFHLEINQFFFFHHSNYEQHNYGRKEEEMSNIFFFKIQRLHSPLKAGGKGQFHVPQPLPLIQKASL